ncbi:hypothetical protein EGW08_017367, partial [Elysia chlorotica]
MLSPRSRLALQKQQLLASSNSSNPNPVAAAPQNPTLPAYSVTSPHPLNVSFPGAGISVSTSSSSPHSSHQYPTAAGDFDSQPDQPTVHSSSAAALPPTTSTPVRTTEIMASTTLSSSSSTSSSVETNQRAPLCRQNSDRDLYVELKEFLNSANCSSRDSAGSWGGIHPPLASNSTSSFSSRSGSISSHRGSNGFTGDFLEFWNHYRRRSSQMSQLSDYSSSSYATTSSTSSSGASRRSSSSHKHSTDFSTDLEDISESLLKPSHGVIEEEGGGLLTLITDFATHVVSTAVRNGVISAMSPSSTSRPQAPDETKHEVLVEQDVV